MCLMALTGFHQARLATRDDVIHTTCRKSCMINSSTPHFFAMHVFLGVFSACQLAEPPVTGYCPHTDCPVTCLPHANTDTPTRAPPPPTPQATERDAKKLAEKERLAMEKALR